MSPVMAADFLSRKVTFELNKEPVINNSVYNHLDASNEDYPELAINIYDVMPKQKLSKFKRLNANHSTRASCKESNLPVAVSNGKKSVSTGTVAKSSQKAA